MEISFQKTVAGETYSWRGINPNSRVWNSSNLVNFHGRKKLREISCPRMWELPSTERKCSRIRNYLIGKDSKLSSELKNTFFRGVRFMTRRSSQIFGKVLNAPPWLITNCNLTGARRPFNKTKQKNKLKKINSKSFKTAHFYLVSSTFRQHERSEAYRT